MRPIFALLAMLAAASPIPALITGGVANADAPDVVGSWIGTLRTTAGTCPDQSPSTLVVDRRHLSFAPADGVLVLHGVRSPDSTRLHAQLSLPGMDHKPVSMVFEAHAEGKEIAGIYGTPSCRAEIRLRRPGDRPPAHATGH